MEQGGESRMSVIGEDESSIKIKGARKHCFSDFITTSPLWDQMDEVMSKSARMFAHFSGCSVLGEWVIEKMLDELAHLEYLMCCSVLVGCQAWGFFCFLNLCPRPPPSSADFHQGTSDVLTYWKPRHPNYQAHLEFPRHYCFHTILYCTVSPRFGSPSPSSKIRPSLSSTNFCDQCEHLKLDFRDFEHLRRTLTCFTNFLGSLP